MFVGLILGLVVGLTIAMLAVGLVLVYKSGRFVNLAHSQLGALSAVFLATLVLDHGWSWWLAFPVVVGIGVAIGVGVERTIIRRLRHQGRRAVTYLFVTIGVGQILLALTFIPALAPDRSTLFRERYPLPFTTVVRVGGATLTGAHLMILVLAPVTLLALGSFLRFTMLGKSIRAAASNPDSARLSGVSVDRVNAITWAMAGALSAVTAVLLAPGQAGLNAGVLGPSLLLRALGAAALGGFVSIPAAVIGGVGLGVIEQVAISTTSDGSIGDVVVFVAIVAVLLLRGRTISAAMASDDGGSEDRSPIVIPTLAAGRRLVQSHRSLLGGGALVIGAVIPLLPYFARESNRFFLIVILTFATLGIALTMLLGWAGQVSLGHFAVLGMGAFVAARLGAQGRSVLLVMVIAGLVGALTMAVVGLPALRLRGLTLAVTTLGFAVLAPTWLFKQSWLGPPDGVTAEVDPLGFAEVGKLDSLLSIYYLGLVLLAATAATAGLLRRSSPGRLVVAARDNEQALASFGITPATVKVSVLAVSGFIAACAGVVYGAAWSNVGGELFQPALSFSALAIPVIGGIGSVPGAVLGAIVIYVPLYFLAPQVESLLGEFGRGLGLQLALSGPGLVLIPMLYPRGVAGAFSDRWARWLRSLDKEPDAGETPDETPNGLPVRERRDPVVAALAGVARDDTRSEPIEGALPLEVTGAEVAFGGIKALQGVDLHVNPGEIVGLIGTNGAGKSTLLNVISGTVTPDDGEIVIGGHRVTPFAPEIRAGFGLGRSFQAARLFPGLTLVETVQVALARRYRVGFVSSMLGAPWARATEVASRAEAEDLLAANGLAPWANTLASELSTGTRRLADLTLQIASGPDVLLLDEPTAGVAQREAEAFGPMMREVRERLDCSMLVVEHDMPLLMGLCDRMYAMDSGRIIAEGTPEEIRNDPAVVASYLGTDETAVLRSGASTPAPAAKRPLRTASANATVGVTGEPVLRADDINFSYGPLQVLFGISLAVQPGEALALLGTNGAGKSTLLRVCAGLDAPSEGSVHLDGADITGRPAEQLVSEGLVLISGGKAVFPDMTIEENLDVQALTLRSATLAAERKDAVYERFPRLTERRSQLAGNLSGGEQQQLALGKALVLDPMVLCIDELSLGLAPAIVGELLELVRSIHESGVSIILVEQSLNIAAQLCNRAVFLEKGEVRFEGPTTELLERDDIARAVFLGST